MDISAALEAILFAAGESVPLARLSLVLDTDEEELGQIAGELAARYEREGRGIRILRLDDRLQMCSDPDYAPFVIKALEQRRPPMLSQSALETLAIVAYYQPVTRATIDRVRGVDSSYTVGALAERGLIEICGRLDAPGRPALFRTTDVFLRTMGIARLSELPPLPELAGSEGVEKLQQAIHELQNAADPNQIALEEVLDGAKEA
jgi:segregation and condensation protein B